MNEFWIILVGALVGVSCGIPGTFLMLRKMAMLGDAIAHAVLPGIVLAYLISGTRNSPLMWVGAGVVGVLTTFFIEFLSKRARLQSDAAIGVVFTLLFAIGVILISANGGNIDLDLDCVLFGEIAYTPLDLVETPSGINLGPRAMWILLPTTLVVLLFTLLTYKELTITTFDPDFAETNGYKVLLWNYLLMGLVAFTTVAAFEAVGGILVVAFLAVPPATAFLLSNKLSVVIILSSVFGILSSLLGYYLSAALDSAIAPAMSVVAGLFFILAFVSAKIRRKPIKIETVAPLQQTL